MSMSKLSTELDSKIASCLIGDTKALNTFSKVSKYYRIVTEPYLYNTLAFSLDEDYALKLLLFTLLDRNDLALYITSFRLQARRPYGGDSVAVREARQFKVNEETWAYADKIRGKINEIATRGSGFTGSYDNKLKWFTALLITTPDRMDAALALVLCMATNIRSITFSSTNDRQMTRTVMQTHWTGVDVRPFMKLEYLSYGPNNRIVILPSTVSLRVVREKPFLGRTARLMPLAPVRPILYSALQPENPSLRKLALIGIPNFTPAVVTTMVSSACMANLTELIIQRCGIYSDRIASDYDMPAFVRTLECHVPKLQKFEFTRQLYEGAEFPRFDTFKNLKQLRALAVNFNMLVPRNDISCESLSQPHLLLPENLNHLTLDNFYVDPVGRYVANFDRNIKAVRTLREAISPALTYLTSRFSLKMLTFCIDMDYYDQSYIGYHKGLEMDLKDVAFFRHTADELLEVGLRLRVLRAPGLIENFYKLLVEPGWTAPLPHSANFAEGRRMNSKRT